MPSIPRWGLIPPFLVVALAVFLRYPQPSGTNAADETFCYLGVRTQNEDSDSAHCFTVSDGIFTNVFIADSTSDQSPVTPEPTHGYAIPGLWDGHGHLLQYGEFLHSVDLFGSASIDDVLFRVGDYLDRNPGAGKEDAWIRGVGWDQMVLGGMPTAAQLDRDERLKGLYIMLDRVDVHCAWVSQAVLDLLPDEVPNVPGGEVVREPGMGVFCDNAMDLVTGLWPRPDNTRRKEFVRTAMSSLNSVGLVGMHDAGAYPHDVALFEEMSTTDDWTVRVYAMLECKVRNTFCPDHPPRIAQENGRLSMQGVKLFADGALGSWGSAMIEPYADRPDTSGSLLVNSSTLTQLAKSWSSAGFQVNIHAIGDLANGFAVDAMEAALKDVCPEPEGSLRECQAKRRFRLEHAQIIHPEDQERIHKMGIIPSIQPTHATSDMKFAEQRLGKDRTAKEAYRMRSFRDLNPVLGSDFPVEPPDPFQGIFAAVTRRSPQTGRNATGGSDGWHTEEALTLDDALLGFTKGAAYGAFLEGKAGVIQKGAFADWVVLDKPLENFDVNELRSLKVRETWVAGRRVYKRVD